MAYKEKNMKNKTVMKGNKTYKMQQSAYLSDRGMPEMGDVTYKKEQTSMLSKRGEPQMKKPTAACRYKDYN